MIKAIKNIILCLRFPFLVITDFEGKKKYRKVVKFTFYDMFPEGWWKAFGIKLCKELKESIKKEKRKNFYIIDIKEKYGTLRIDTNCYSPEIEKVLDKYEELSKYICIKCGKKATKVSKGWISPYCDNCIENIEHDAINKVYKKSSYNLDEYCIK